MSKKGKAKPIHELDQLLGFGLSELNKKKRRSTKMSDEKSCEGNGIRTWPDCFEDCPYEFDEEKRKQVCVAVRGTDGMWTRPEVEKPTEPIEIDMDMVERHVSAMCKAIEGLPKCKTSELIIALALVGSRSLPPRSEVEKHERTRSGKSSGLGSCAEWLS